jgi:hypothetical protein
MTDKLFHAESLVDRSVGVAALIGLYFFQFSLPPRQGQEESPESPIRANIFRPRRGREHPRP